jgi:hypothetical protein
MRRLTRWALIAGAGVVLVLSGIDGAEVMGQAHADPLCAPDVAESCQHQVDQQQADVPNPVPPPRHRIWVSCAPAALGAHCTQRSVP